LLIFVNILVAALRLWQNAMMHVQHRWQPMRTVRQHPARPLDTQTASHTAIYTAADYSMNTTW